MKDSSRQRLVEIEDLAGDESPGGEVCGRQIAVVRGGAGGEE